MDHGGSEVEHAFGVEVAELRPALLMKGSSVDKGASAAGPAEGAAAVDTAEAAGISVIGGGGGAVGRVGAEHDPVGPQHIHRRGQHAVAVESASGDGGVACDVVQDSAL